MTTTDLERRYAANPATGERLLLDSPADQLATAMGEAKMMRDQLYLFEQRIGSELLARMDADANWTMHAKPYKIQGRSPEPPEAYDVDALRPVLEELVTEGLISREAAVACVKTEVSYKPIAAGIKKLRKLGGKVAAALEECRKEIDSDEYARHRPAPRVTVLP